MNNWMLTNQITDTLKIAVVPKQKGVEQGKTYLVTTIGGIDFVTECPNKKKKGGKRT